MAGQPAKDHISNRMRHLLQRLLGWRAQATVQSIPRADWRLMLFAGLIFVALAIGTLNSSSFFLHFDDPTQHLAGWLFLHSGQWAYSGNKALIMWILAALTWLAGATPLNETVFLSLLGVGAAMAVADLAYLALGQKRWALLSVLLWLTLGSTLYYLRMQMGYPLAFFVIGLALYARRYFVPAGICLLLAALAHISFAVPVALWLGISFVLGIGPRSVVEWIGLGVPMIGGYLGYEYIALRFSTEIWHTAKNFLREIQLLDAVIFPDNPLGYLWFLFKASNGVPMTGYVTAALFGYPVLLLLQRPASPGSRLRHALYLTCVPFIGYMVIRSGINHRITVLRPLAGVIPLLVIIGTHLFSQWVRWLHQHSQVAEKLVGLLLSVGVSWQAIQIEFLLVRCSTTAYPAVEMAFEEATEQNIPVVYLGNDWIGAYYRAVTGATTLINPGQPPLATETTNTSSLAALSSSTPLMVIWARNEAPDGAALDSIEAAGGHALRPQGAITSIPDPARQCVIGLPESRGATIDRLRAAHPLLEVTRPLDPDAAIWIWQTRP